MLDLAAKLKEFNEQRAILDAAGADSRVLLVDATNTYIRCFCATPSMNDDGDHVGGVTGFLKSIGLFVRQYHPTRIICVFDGAGGSQRRRKLFSDYKDKKRSMQRLNRTYNFSSIEEEKKSMRWQMHLLVEILGTLPITVFAVDNIEADDTIAYLASLVKERNGKAIIMSTDKDFLQLVGPNCEVYNPIKKKTYTESVVIEEYGIHPKNFLLYRAIEGDKSDNIPGIKGIGRTTLLKYFSDLNSTQFHISDFVSRSESIEPKKRKSIHTKILNEIELLHRNVKLMQLNEVDISGTTKIEILNLFDKQYNVLNKMGLTKLLSDYKILSSFGNYDEWVRTTWIPLGRFHKQEK